MSPPADRRFGVFMCGTVNARNRMGGYAGGRMFMARFDPDVPDRVIDAAAAPDTGPSFIAGLCDAVYRRRG